MPPPKKPAPQAKPSALDQMIADCVKKAKARKRSGQTDKEWRANYSASLKSEERAAPMSETPFAGDAFKKK